MRPGDDNPPGPLIRRIGWLVLIWAASVLALGAIAALLRAVLL